VQHPNSRQATVGGSVSGLAAETTAPHCSAATQSVSNPIIGMRENRLLMQSSPMVASGRDTGTC